MFIQPGPSRLPGDETGTRSSSSVARPAQVNSRSDEFTQTRKQGVEAGRIVQEGQHLPRPARRRSRPAGALSCTTPGRNSTAIRVPAR